MKTSISATRPESDWQIGGTWGNAIQWQTDWKNVKVGELKKKTFQVYGFNPRNFPIPGQTLTGAFEGAWIKFKFLSIEPCGNPQDMYFAEVKAVEVVNHV